MVPTHPLANLDKRPDKPLVSIIMAAYNRGNVLRYAVASVVRSTFDNWELLVIGDACTDDTEVVVSSFNDSRIRFVNLEKNIGEQSGPNNEGFRLAKGRYIAYLNQDDLWFSDHLEKSLQAMRDTQADWVFSVGICFLNETKCILQGAYPYGVYNPKYPLSVPASLWLMKRDVLEETGGWRFYRTVRLAPSQDLLLRAWKAGKRICVAPWVTVVRFPSSFRDNSYANRDFSESAAFYERICAEPDFRETQLLNACLRREADGILERSSIGNTLRTLVLLVLRRIAHLLFGIWPGELSSLLRIRTKGKNIDVARKRRGLPVKKE